jgi:hypothetical protein
VPHSDANFGIAALAGYAKIPDVCASFHSPKGSTILPDQR